MVTAHVVAGVADRLQLRDLSQHGANLAFRLVGEVGVAHLVEVFGNLYFHVVGDVLILVYAVVNLHELVFVLLSEQVSHHAEHALYALCEALYLFLSLQHGELRRLHDATLYEAQAEVVVVSVGPWLPNPAAHFSHMLDKGQQYDGVGNVEARVEGCEGEGELRSCGDVDHRVETHEAAGEVDEMLEDAQHPDDAEDIEEKVAEGRAACLGVGGERHEVGGERGAYVLAQHEGYAKIYGQSGLGAQHHGDGHEGG